MKFTKSNVLSSLGVAGMILGAVAPAVANAAQTIGYPDGYKASTVTVKGGDVTTKEVDDAPGFISNKRNGEDVKGAGYGPGYVTVVKGTDGAWDTASNPNSNSGRAFGVSDAKVQIVEGYLTLDAVPDFNFGTVTAGAKAGVSNFSGAIQDDGNDEGVLQVTDSRSTSLSTDGGDSSKFATMMMGKLDAVTAVYNGLQLPPKDPTNPANPNPALLTQPQLAAFAGDGTLTADKAIAAVNALTGADKPTAAQQETLTELVAAVQRSNTSRDGMGYSLQVQLGGFKQLNKTGDGRTDTSAVSGWSLALPNLRGVNGVISKDSDDKNGFSFNGTNDIDAKGNVTADPATDAGNVVTIATAPSGTSWGTAKVNFAAPYAMNRTYLQVPDKAEQGAWDAPIYWILNASVDPTQQEAY